MGSNEVLPTSTTIEDSGEDVCVKGWACVCARAIDINQPPALFSTCSQSLSLFDKTAYSHPEYYYNTTLGSGEISVVGLPYGFFHLPMQGQCGQ